MPDFHESGQATIKRFLSTEAQTRQHANDEAMALPVAGGGRMTGRVLAAGDGRRRDGSGGDHAQVTQTNNIGTSSRYATGCVDTVFLHVSK